MPIGSFSRALRRRQGRSSHGHRPFDKIAGLRRSSKKLAPTPRRGRLSALTIAEGRRARQDPKDRVLSKMPPPAPVAAAVRPARPAAAAGRRADWFNAIPPRGPSKPRSTIKEAARLTAGLKGSRDLVGCHGRRTEDAEKQEASNRRAQGSAESGGRTGNTARSNASIGRRNRSRPTVALNEMAWPTCERSRQSSGEGRCRNAVLRNQRTQGSRRWDPTVVPPGPQVGT